MAASPFMRVLFPAAKIKMALKTVSGKTKNIVLLILRTVAIESAPKATCESPSPIKEKRFKTSVTPKREEQREIKTPTIKA